MKKLQWCHYVCERGGKGEICILESGTMRGHIAFTLAEDGVKFPHRGDDAILWLVRDGEAIVVARRSNGRIHSVCYQFLIATAMTEEGLSIVDSSRGLQFDDGFEITPSGVICIPGTNSATVFVEVPEKS